MAFGMVQGLLPPPILISQLTPCFTCYHQVAGWLSDFVLGISLVGGEKESAANLCF